MIVRSFILLTLAAGLALLQASGGASTPAAAAPGRAPSTHGDQAQTRGKPDTGQAVMSSGSQDVQNESVELVGSINRPGFTDDGSVVGEYAYVAYGSAGLRIVDVSNPNTPVEVGAFDTPGFAYDVYVADNYAYIADGGAGLRVVDVSNPAAPQEVGSVDTPADGLYAVAVYASDGHVYVAANPGAYPAGKVGGLQVIDVSNPARPTEVSFYETAGWIEDVCASGDYAYVADHHEGLLILNVSNPALPVQVGLYKPEGDVTINIRGSHVVGRYAYVAAGWYGGLRVVDVLNPTAPQEIGVFDTPGMAFNLYVVGNHAYVADGESGGLRVIDISDRGAPWEVGAYDTPGVAYEVYIANNYAYVADDNAGMRVVDVSNAAAPHEVGSYTISGNARGVFVPTIPSPTGQVVGVVRDTNNQPIANATVNASGPVDVSTTTANDGTYTLSDLPAGTYTLTPSKSGYTFSPPSRTVTVPPNATGQDFVGTVQGGDTTPPAAIADLTATPGCAPGTVVLSWTAPGDDGNDGTATEYIVRHQDHPITSPLSWLSATDVEGEPVPQPAGTRQSMTASGLVAGQTYYFGIVARDEAGNEGGLSNSPSAVPGSTMPWTIMIYLDGDNAPWPSLDPNYVHVFNQLESAADNPCVNVIVAWDGAENNDSAYYQVRHDTNLNQLATYTEGVDRWSRGELNMGDPTTLTDFVQWARTNYPAQHYALFISNHGTGLNGTAIDHGDLITVRELGDALATATSNGANRIDVVFADSCLMAMIEDAYQIQDFADFYVASENLLWIPGRADSGPYDDYVSGIRTSTSPRDLVAAIVTHYATWLDNDVPAFPYTISAVDLGQTNDLVTAINDLASNLSPQMATYASQVSAARTETQKFDSNNNRRIDLNDQYVDLYHFADRIRAYVPDSTVQNLAQAVMNAVDNYVVSEVHDSGQYNGVTWDLSNSHGVSVFFPPNASSFYDATRYDFAVGATWPGQGQSTATVAPSGAVTWGPMLVNYFQITQPDGPDTPNPPDLVAPESPAIKLVAQISEPARAVAVQDNHAFVIIGPRLAVFDITNPANPTMVGQTAAILPDNAQTLYVVGNYVYVAAAYDGLRVIDISNPTAPVEVGAYDTPFYATDVQVSGSYAYVADIADLRVIDISNPTAPAEVGTYSAPDEVWGVYVAGNYAYVAARYAGLRVLDVSNPAAPVEVGAYATPGWAGDISVVGNYAYVVEYWSGLRVVDVSDPTAPAEVGAYDTPGDALDVHIADGYAYVADGDAGLRVIDVLDLTAPTEVGAYDTPGNARDVYVADGYVYVADGDSGLSILRFTGWLEPASNADFDSARCIDWGAPPWSMPYTQYTGRATTASDEPVMSCIGNQHGANTVWYRFVSPDSGTLHLDTFGSDYDTVLAVYTGTRGNLAEVSQGCNDDIQGLQSALDIPVVAGETYHVQVASYPGTDGGNLELSVEYTPPPGCSQFMQNGGFEQGPGSCPWWQGSSGGYELIYSYRPHTGSYGAWLGGYDDANESFSQSITIPENAQSATLTFWWYVESTEASTLSETAKSPEVPGPIRRRLSSKGHSPRSVPEEAKTASEAHDYLDVLLWWDVDWWAVLESISDMSVRNTWTQSSIDLTDWRGGTYDIQFWATTDSNNSTSFFVDDISLEVCTTCPLDFDGSGVVDLPDVQRVADRWRLPAIGQPYDCDGDGVITVADIMCVARAWGPCR